MPFKYEPDVMHLPECPPVECKPCNRECYRFTFDVIEHPNNFLPVAKINPARKFPDDTVCCSAHALSFYETKDAAIKAFSDLLNKFKQARKAVGSHVAKGTITEDDGGVTEIDDKGHFDLFENDGIDWVPRFEIIEGLPA